MFGHASNPDTRNYRFGALAPTEHADTVWDQIHMAHKYRNKLVEIELLRRKKCEDARLALAPSYNEANEAVETARRVVADLTDAALKCNKATRSRSAPKELRDEIKAARAELKAARANLSAIRKLVRESQEIKDAEHSINIEAQNAVKAARATCGLYWGTYLKMEQDMASAKKDTPRFQRWDGGGTLAVQIQHGMSIEELYSCADSRLRLEVSADQDERSAKRARLWMRVGSQGSRKEPVFAVIPVLLHRPFPIGSRVQWVYLIASRVGTHTKWSVTFCLSHAPDIREKATEGSVTVSIEWNRTLDATIGVSLNLARWCGSDGESGTLAMSAQDVSRWEKSWELSQTRDVIFNSHRQMLAEWLKSAKNIPDWMREATSTLHAWRSESRLAALVIKWRESRFDGDAEVFALLEAWRKRDKHLYDWEAHQMRKAVNWRVNLYRTFAARLATKYKTLRIAKREFTRERRQPTPESEKGRQETIAKYRQIMSLGGLQSTLLDRFAEVEIVAAEKAAVA